MRIKPVTISGLVSLGVRRSNSLLARRRAWPFATSRRRARPSRDQANTIRRRAACSLAELCERFGLRPDRAAPRQMREQGQGRRLRQQRRLLEPHQTTQGGDAFAGQAGPRLHRPFPCAHVLIFVVSQALLTSAESLGSVHSTRIRRNKYFARDAISRSASVVAAFRASKTSKPTRANSSWARWRM